MDNNVPEEGVPIQSRQRFGIFPKVALALLVALLPFLGFYLGTVYTKATSCPIITYPYLPGPDIEENCQEIQKKDCPVCSTTTWSAQDQKWTTADFGVYTIQYPIGLHIAQLERNGETSGSITLPTDIVINSTPLNMLAHGGPMGELTIRDVDLTKFPEAVISAEMTKFKKSLRNVEEENVETGVGAARHITGEANIYDEWRFVERYYLALLPKGATDDKQLVIYAENFTPSKSDILRGIVQSFKN